MKYVVDEAGEKATPAARPPLPGAVVRGKVIWSYVIPIVVVVVTVGIVMVVKGMGGKVDGVTWGSPSVGAGEFFPPEPAPVRSPIPEVGEHLKHLIRWRRLARLKAPAVKAGQAVGWARAKWYVGKRITVEGTVKSARNIGPLCFLDFSEHWQGAFAIVVYRRTFAAWPAPPQRYFVGKRIEVTGKVTLYKGRAEMKVTRAGQIRVVGKGRFGSRGW